MVVSFYYSCFDVNVSERNVRAISRSSRNRLGAESERCKYRVLNSVKVFNFQSAKFEEYVLSDTIRSYVTDFDPDVTN